MNKKIIAEHKKHEAWSKDICKNYGEAAAICFAIGSDLLLDTLKHELEELSEMPRGAHIGQVPFSVLAWMLPLQFLTRYDFEFLYILRSTVRHFRQIAHNGSPIVAHSVMQELALYLIVDSFRSYIENPDIQSELHDELDGNWEEWIFEIFEDTDIELCLYSDFALTNDNQYHFDHWMESAFFC